MADLATAMKSLDEDGVLKIVRERNDSGVEPLEILGDLQEGMRLVGEEFEKKNYYLSELIMSSTIFKQAVEIINERLTKACVDPKYGTYVLGTVQNDIHDIGKDIVATLLSCQGFNVVDLGVNVPADTFVQAVKEHKPRVVGLSCLLTTAFEDLKKTVDALEAAGLRSSVKVMIGGATVTEETRQYTGADVFCLDANKAVTLAQQLAEGN